MNDVGFMCYGIAVILQSGHYCYVLWNCSDVTKWTPLLCVMELQWCYKVDTIVVCYGNAVMLQSGHYCCVLWNCSDVTKWTLLLCVMELHWCYKVDTIVVIFVNNQPDAQLFFIYVYFYSLHVSVSHLPIIRRTNCINTTSGMCHSV